MNQSYRFVIGMIVLLIANNKILTADFYIHSWKQGYNTCYRYLIYDLTKLRVRSEYKEQKIISFGCNKNEYCVCTFNSKRK